LQTLTTIAEGQGTRRGSEFLTKNGNGLGSVLGEGGEALLRGTARSMQEHKKGESQDTPHGGNQVTVRVRNETSAGGKKGPSGRGGSADGGFPPPQKTNDRYGGKRRRGYYTEGTQIGKEGEKFRGGIRSVEKHCKRPGEEKT